MTEPNAPAVHRKVWFHVDMDGLDAIYRAHGREWKGGRDDFYLSAVDNSLAFFEREGIRATYFLIAGDLEDPAKRAALDRVVRAGHRIASHGLHHRYLNQISPAEKREEIFASRKSIQDTLGLSCEGFRAPGYSIDFESLELLRDAGYRYDTTLFPSYEFRNRLGLQRIFPEPFALFPESNFFEIPLPMIGPWLPPFHPCYAFYLSRAYYRLGLRAIKKRYSYLTLLFHLTDFAEQQALGQGFKLGLFTNNFISGKGKLGFLRDLVAPLRGEFAFTTTEEFLAGWPQSAPNLNPRTVLGISTTHETGACIVRDNKILSAINEERLSRIKLDTAYPPVQSIREAIRIAGILPAEIEAVAVAGLHWKDLLPQTLDSLWRDFRDFHSLNDYFPHFCRIAYRLYYFWRAWNYDTVLDFLQSEYGIRPKLWFVEHHEAHAVSVHATGKQPETLCVTADGVGDDVCITFNRARGATVRRAETFFYPNSFGQFYTACTQVLGFKGGRHEGKITGLAGYGKPNPDLKRKIEATLFNQDGSFRLHKKFYSEGYPHIRWRDIRDWLAGRFSTLTIDYRNYKPPLKRLLAGYSREDVAHTFQVLLEREMVRLAMRHRPSGPYHLSIAGGVFANVKLNMAFAQKLGAESIFIFPNMGDGGLCVGAALSVTGALPALVPNMYLGTGYSEAELDTALARFPALSHRRPERMARTIAELLADRKIVARFDGRMEFGPRALGNRSILYYCGDRTVNDWLNHQLRRTEFMPFAPVGLWEDAREYFVLREGEMRPTEFMTLVVPCTEKMQTTCPAAVHVDGTARPQLVRRDINAPVYEILQEYKKLTGISCLINTSFNMHEEPIVRSPEDALTAFRQSKLDYLVLGPYLVWETDGSGGRQDIKQAESTAPAQAEEALSR